MATIPAAAPYVNTSHDLSAGELVTVRAAIEAAYASRIATVSEGEAAAAALLIEGCRGRGIGRPLDLLLGAYHRPEQTIGAGYEKALAVELGATEGARAQ